MTYLTLDKNNDKNISPQRHKIRNLWNLEVIPLGLIMVEVYDLKNQKSEKIKLMNAKFFGKGNKIQHEFNC